MKKVFLFLSGLGAASLVSAQLVITSFNQNGELTWTNSVSNATYRVEWASAATGSWNKFDALTNLTLLSAATNSVTVKVPTFYRVIWLDAPQHAGIWDYSGFSTTGTLVATGRFSLSAQTNPITGSWKFDRVGNADESWRHPVGAGVIEGFVTNSSLGLDLLPHVFDSQFRIGGEFIDNTYTGVWFAIGFGFEGRGTFSAQRQGLPR